MEQNYLPLFRKYRPQSFKDIVGQESLVKALSNAIELNRIANAYLFCGPRGTGKTSTARIFAKSLNCVEGPTLEPCQKCASCIDITNAAGLDVIEIDAASNRGIQDAKDLIAKVQYAPINGKYKIFIIDEVHMLSNDAFNALLKTFEEPPKNVIFILATTEPHKVLETIVSRCQRFDLKRITIEDIVKKLREISDIEQIKITDEALLTIAKNVSGGLRDSLALLDQVSILGVKEEISKELIEEVLGKINFSVLLNLLNDIYNEDIAKTLQDVDEIYAKGNEPRNLAENFIEFLRNVILVINSKDIEIIKNFTSLINDDIEKIKQINFDKDKIIKILNVIIEYYKEIKVSTNPYLWMELAAIGACKLNLTPNNQVAQQVQPIQQIQTAPQNVVIQKPIQEVAQSPIKKALEMQAPPQPQPQVQAQPQVEVETKVEVQTQPQNPEPQPIQQQNVSGGDGIALWQAIISAIKSLPARAFYTGVAKLISIDDKKVKLGFLHENALLQAKSASKLSQLEAAIQAVSSGIEVEFTKISADAKTIDVKPKIAPQKPIQQSPQPTQQIQVEPKEINEKNNAEEEKEEKERIKKEKKNYSPKVQEMIEQFSGRIIEEP